MHKTILLLALAALLGANPAGAREVHRTRHALVMKATAFAGVGHITASGTRAYEGIVAADPAVLPLGTRIRISGSRGYDGDYLVADTGAGVKGHHIDVCVRSRTEARQFGVKHVRVTVTPASVSRASTRRNAGP